MQPTQPSQYATLLRVFYTALINGVITRQEVVAWADGVIAAEDEPDYFFIAISLCNNTNDICELISDNVACGLDTISSRAFLGFVYQKFTTEAIDLRQAVIAIDVANYGGILSALEKAEIYEICDYEQWMEFDEATELLRNFLFRYKDLTIDNYEQWAEINLAIEEKLISQQLMWLKLQHENIKTNQQKTRSKKIFSNSFVYTFAVLALSIVIDEYRIITSGIPTDKFTTVAYSFSALYLALFVAYHIVWLIQKLMVKFFGS